MIYDLLNITVSPEDAVNKENLRLIAARKLRISPIKISDILIVKKSIDARQREIKVILSLKIGVGESISPKSIYKYSYQYGDVSSAPSVIVVGAGPAGLFAALRLIELGFRPIVIERGKSVSERKKDIALMNRNQGLNTESNYSFGEGGAGTFSDGKLYTRSKKKGSIRRILEIFHLFGAQDEILYEAHPHIGTDRLPIIIKNMREKIIACGGEVRFETKMVELLIQDNFVRGILLENGEKILSSSVILATGHSARDVYQMLYTKNIALEAKGFAMGVRVEHPQVLIDSIQYHSKQRNKYLPAASYSLVAQSDGRGVYSFCMCPGGHIVPASTEEGGIVVNGMSASHRGGKLANSGIVVEIQPEDISDYMEKYGVMGGLKFQQYVENLAFLNNGGGKDLKAPAQRLKDFVEGRLSDSLPETTYLPGIISSPMHFWLPEQISSRLRDGFRQFNRKMRGFLTNEAIVVGVESRSSSPLRIPRNRETFQHISLDGFYPCGEGAGYAGGITSSAMDGEACAEAIAKKCYNK